MTSPVFTSFWAILGYAVTLATAFVYGRAFVGWVRERLFASEPEVLPPVLLLRRVESREQD